MEEEFKEFEDLEEELEDLEEDYFEQPDYKKELKKLEEKIKKQIQKKEVEEKEVELQIREEEETKGTFKDLEERFRLLKEELQNPDFLKDLEFQKDMKKLEEEFQENYEEKPSKKPRDPKNVRPEGKLRAGVASKLISRKEFYKIVARTADMPLKEIPHFVRAFEEELLELIWAGESINLNIGTIRGGWKAPSTYRSNKPGHVGEILEVKEKFNYPDYTPSKAARERYIAPEFTPVPVPPEKIWEATFREFYKGEEVEVLDISVPENYPKIPKYFIPDSHPFKPFMLKNMERIIKKAKERKMRRLEAEKRAGYLK